MTPEDFSGSFEPLSEKDLHRKLTKLLIKQYRVEKDIKKIQLSDEYYTTDGKGGYENNQIYTFSGIKITTFQNRTILIQKGDFWNLPNKGSTSATQVFGFEIILDSDNKEIEKSYFLTKSCYCLEELKEKNRYIYQLLASIKNDQLHRQDSAVGRILRKLESISQKVK